MALPYVAAVTAVHLEALGAPRFADRKFVYAGQALEMRAVALLSPRHLAAGGRDVHAHLDALPRAPPPPACHGGWRWGSVARAPQASDPAPHEPVPAEDARARAFPHGPLCRDRRHCVSSLPPPPLLPSVINCARSTMLAGWEGGGMRMRSARWEGKGRRGVRLR